MLGRLTLTAVLMAPLVGACASPTAPSVPAPTPSTTHDSPAAKITLTVRVLVRSLETPLASASVHVGSETLRVDATGTCQVTLVPGDTTVEASATGYVPLSASGVVMNDERWTFYLEPSGALAAGLVARQ